MKRKSGEQLKARLENALGPLDVQLRQPILNDLAARLIEDGVPAAGSVVLLTNALIRTADAAVGAILRLENSAGRLTVEYQQAGSPSERREVLEHFLSQQVRDRASLRGDIAALSRWLDLEAMHERISIQVSRQLDTIEVCYRAARGLCKASGSGLRALEVLSTETVKLLMEHGAMVRYESIRVEALRTLVDLMRLVPRNERMQTVGVIRGRRIANWARGIEAPRWVQVVAIELYTLIEPSLSVPLVESLLRKGEGRAWDPRDGMIIRRHALASVLNLVVDDDTKLRLAGLSVEDPSEYVRQGLSEVLLALPSKAAGQSLARLLREDPSNKVRGHGLFELMRATLENRVARGFTEDIVRERLGASTDALELKVLLEVVERLLVAGSTEGEALVFIEPLNQLVANAALSAEVLELTAALLRRIEVMVSPRLTALRDRLQNTLVQMYEGESRIVHVGESYELWEIERALFSAARGDFSINLHKISRDRYRIRRGEARRWRLWRMLFEMRTLAPDKRKGFLHSQGRSSSQGSLITSHVLAEVTPTRVPGERQLMSTVGGWGPFLPRVDDLLSVSRPFAKPLRIVSSFGTLTLSAPKNWWQRLSVWAHITLKYPKFARLRDDALLAKDSAERSHYARYLNTLGFGVELGETTGSIAGARFEIPSTFAARYLGSVSPFLLPGWLEGPTAYLLSPSGSSPWHLALVAWLVFAGYVIRAAWIAGRIERAREAIPLRIGGWGTRGKSGTERLKAALFHGLRCDVVVKTTGCEAMFIHARKDMPAREIFLYRPYDKATIWEQRNVLHFGERLGAQVFLWECMALQPQFVDVLNTEWMKDTVTTLTNAYPDHEDIMGPGGEDVARVIGRFTPRGGVVFTAEEQMLPLLRESARQRDSRFVAVSPLEGALLASDMLARFPYQEHPANIALVLRMAEHLGIGRELALVEMGDRVVPDLGVLKVYPRVRYETREMEFSNGMSANERAGFMSNWFRLHFDKQDSLAEPGVVTVAVINNRGDRVARSRVFADIVARDVVLDHMVVIGTNQGGIEQFIYESLDGWLKTVSVKTSDPGGPSARLEDVLERFKLGQLKTTLATRFGLMLSGIGVAAEQVESCLADERTRAALASGQGLNEIVDSVASDSEARLREEVKHHIGLLASWGHEVNELRQIVGRGEIEAAEQRLRSLLRKVFQARLYVLWRSDATGDQVVDFVARAFPPGHRARVMGCQNIKGTGLDFVYRWISIDHVRRELGRLDSEPAARRAILSGLMSYSDFGLIDCQEALAKVRAILENPSEEWADLKGLLSSVCGRLEELERNKRSALTTTGKKSVLERFLEKVVEPLVDHWDSIRRRKQATRVMNDVFAVRVGQGRAALLLRELVSRGKGGWLVKDLNKRKNKSKR